MKITFEHSGFTKNANPPRVNRNFYGVYTGDFGKLCVISQGVSKEGAEVFAHLAVISIKDFFRGNTDNSFDANKGISAVEATYFTGFIRQAFQKAIDNINTYIKQNESCIDYDVYIALLLSNSAGVFVARSGECEILLLRENNISRLARAYLACQEMSKFELGNHIAEKEGYFRPREKWQVSRIHIQENIELFKHDKVLLVTKGVYQRVSDKDILKTFIGKDLTASVKNLWNIAQNQRSPEDFTLIALNVIKAPRSSKSSKADNEIKQILKIYVPVFCTSLFLFIATIYPYIKDLVRRFYET